MPIRSREDAVEVESRIEGIFRASADARAEAVRGLFVEVLDFDAAFGTVDLGAAASAVGLPTSVERVAHSGGVHVVFLAMEAGTSDRVRKAELAAAAKSVSEQLGGDLLLVVSNPSSNQLHLVYPSFEGVRPVLRRMVVERDIPRRTAIQQVSNIYRNLREGGSIQLALDRAFDVERVTKDFFAKYKELFEAAKERVTGFGSDEAGKEEQRRFVQTLFNRLMFVYFLSRKGWLTFKGDKDYLNALWRDYQAAEGEHKNFYIDRLRLLFFEGLNNPRSQDTTAEAEADRLIGSVPFLNGGLFEKTELDDQVWLSSNESVTVVPDEAIEPILSDLFDHFNFTVMESTPFDVEVAVDPEMLGKVFEELVTGRHDSGAYYTPRPVVSFMCREALKGYLEGQDTDVTPEALAQFVDQRDTAGISSVAAARKVAGALEEVTVVDPACGSGAYLLGMMQELVELQTALFNVGVDPKGIYDLKLHIIERNLYGVDIDDFAVNIAMLRLWLSLAIEYEGDKPPPLPNLDFKVLCGDSLLGPDPSAGVVVQGALGYDADRVRALGELKSAYMRASDGTEKSRLRQEIEAAENSVREAMYNALGDAGVLEGVINWRVDFAEVFSQRQGFDIAVANPPYVVIKNDTLRNLYSEVIYGRMNTYGLFIHRCLQLMRDGSQLTFINPRTFLTDAYFKQLRRAVRDQAEVKGIVLIEDRHNTFGRVLQECIILHLARLNVIPDSYQVRTRAVWRPDELNDPAGYFAVGSDRVLLGNDYDHALYVGTSTLEYNVFEQMRSTGVTLLDIGLRAETGKVQFDKVRQFSQMESGSESLRLIWAENVQRYAFSSSSKRIGKEWLGGEISQYAQPNLRGDAILTQRTTANEQPRRIIATWVRTEDLPEKGAYSENGTNFIPIDRSVQSIHCLLACLNSSPMEFIFRRLNSNVHVSAGELNRLPLPVEPIEEVRSQLETHVCALMELQRTSRSKETVRLAIAHELAIDNIVGSLYGIVKSDMDQIRSSLPAYERVYGQP
ncbi:MAG: Eco57I restriction-modification methylase domain-containing protein [Dehalococcoidia bacterium]|nr:Eco57I restriction-modification methylase domain-containing protein [Dehalococcoidia bacterium]